ncbi:hypothetical protein N7532_001419 [Penicillium argentinense]|uniref:Uncharacterized protein n=1 Tax=Penicillium argentinense TaxID=1131581 RepID=A0A9W9G2H1_9EURO|nr:uncharacterized protein N7532_001419 [Penicillium argentinense]KAJ5110884.1 hypothetical protein N7532_001419 [Penicillium argentinense]
MQNQAISAEYVTTSWTVVRGFFAREQHLVEHISRIEKALHQAGWQNQQDRAAYTTLASKYEQLYAGYQRILEMYDSLAKTVGEAEESNYAPPATVSEEGLAIIIERPDHSASDNEDEYVEEERNSV